MKARTLVLTAALLLGAAGAACSRDSGSVSSGGSIGATTVTALQGLSNEEVLVARSHQPDLGDEGIHVNHDKQR